jgi:N-acetylglutamate synthase-like GNAT family acetyltransferase
MRNTDSEPPDHGIVPFQRQYGNSTTELILGIQRDEFGFPITLADQPDLSNVEQYYQQGTGNFWVALKDDRVIGTIALLDIGDGQAALRKMFVAAEYRGGHPGIAHQPLATLLSYARGQGVREIYLGTTDKFLAAHRFYEKNGFQLVEPDTLPPRFPKMKVDTRFYRPQLVLAR